MVARGKSMDTVTEVQAVGSFLSSPISFEKLGRVYYFCEAIDRLTAERVEEQGIYQLLYDFIVFCRRDARSTEEVAIKMNEELKKVLHVLGFIDEEKRSQHFDVEEYIENLIEGKIKSKKMITK
jgi:recombinational DNA repair protein (RecF pathway)